MYIEGRKSRALKGYFADGKASGAFLAERYPQEIQPFLVQLHATVPSATITAIDTL